MADLKDPFLLLHIYITLVKHLQKLPSVFGGHLLFANIPLRKEEGSHAYSLRVGGKFYLLISGRSVPLLRSRCTNPPSPTSCDLHMFMITFASCFTMVKAHGWGTFPNVGLDLATTLSLASYFGNPPPRGFTLHKTPHTPTHFLLLSLGFSELNSGFSANMKP
jgi:hypothetical protein